jgi:protoheme IX farnesyltransferase
MSRFQKLAIGAVLATLAMVVIGAVVRATGSGMGCPDWPLCHGQLIPPLGDTAAWIEWVHRTWGGLIGFIVLALVVAAWRTQRATRSVVVGSVAALVLTGFQAWLGKITVDTGNSDESVTAHHASAMLLLAVLVFVAVRSGYPETLPRHGASQRSTLLVAFSSILVFALLLFGAHVTATGSALVFPDWPLFDGRLIPEFSDDPAAASLQMSHFLHRVIAAVVGVVLVITTLSVWRRVRRGQVESPRLLALLGTATALYAIQVIVGALQIWTTLAPWAISLHVGLGGAIWGLMAAATFTSWYDARVAAEAALGPGPGRSDQVPSPTPTEPYPGQPASLRERVSAYIALTKPRIIELLLVTTVPAMVLAWKTVDGLAPAQFGWLVVITLVGGSLAAGAANAINCYLDRDIDEVMVRTRRRPLPAHRVEPEDALMFGLVLAVISFGVLAFGTNLVAAFLALLAIAFYVVVYTLILKRSTPQNIVLGGAAGALPPVIGWAAVTGDITLPALLLFAVVFYWTPPHFWALSLRIRDDYQAAGVPMLPVTHGVPETTRQIALYSVLMVALTLAFFAVAHMGLVFLAGALLLGGLFLFQAFAMWREGTDRRAVRLYKYSITYLTGLFALIVLDVAVFLPLA